MIEGLTPQAEVCALMTAVEDLMEGVSEEYFARAPQTLKKVDESPFGSSVRGTRFAVVEAEKMIRIRITRYVFYLY